MSNESVVTATMPSFAVSPGSRAIDRRKFTTAPCETATPFGRPVEPEVKMTYATSEAVARAFTRPAGAAAISSASASRHTSEARCAGSSPESVDVVTRRPGAASSRMSARRSFGNAGSRGT